MKNKRKIIIFLIILTIIITLGVTYTLFTSNIIGGNKVAIAGDIYMKLNGSDKIQLTNVIPMTKEEALEKTDNIFNFQIVGKNTSNKDIYYGISLETGEVPEGKTAINPSDLVVYLESDENILVDGVRYQDFSNHIYVDTISKNTTSNIEKDYNLRVWLRDGIIVSDTVPNATYSLDEWNNIYMSLKVKVDGNLNYMNMPLSIEHDNESVENNKQYFISTIKNFLNPDEVGEVLEENETMKLEVESSNSNIVFSYKDSRGNLVEEENNSLTIDYIFNKKENVETQVFITPLNDANTNTNITIKLTTSDNKVYTQVINMDIHGNNYCLNNGFNKLGDCILVSEILSSNVKDAKEYISTKTYNLNDTAPNYTYIEDVIYNIKDVYTLTGSKFKFATDYEFDEKTGKYTLTGTMVDDILSDTYKNYYTCGPNWDNRCDIMYKVLETSIGDNMYKISLGDRYSSKIASSIKSEQGIYKAEDDYGDSYFFRGEVLNNNASFGGYNWKIVRINGDNSIRMIYNGRINNTTYTYNDKAYDPTYVGYMYGENFKLTESSSSVNRPFSELIKYVFATDYRFDEEEKVFYLEGDMISKTPSEAKDDVATYKYTCRMTSETESCNTIHKINYIKDSATINVNYISYSSSDFDSTRTNEISSNIKNVIDLWYETNIVEKKDSDGKLLSDYIVDATFCNDRSISSGDVYNLAQDTRYRTFKSLYESSNKVASLKCSDVRDKFSKTEKYGNAKLTHPIALITADEVALAGGKSGTKNSNYYLNNKYSYVTMTPSYYSGTHNDSRVWIVNYGELSIDASVSSKRIIVPVINLSSNVLITQGDGTIENPYILKLA